VRLPRMQFTIRRMMICVAVLSVPLGATVLALRPTYQGLAVVNGSGQVISRVIVSIAAEQTVITDLADGAKATVPLPVRDDPGFNVAGTFGNGTMFSGGFKITGNPRRFSRIACTVGQDGKVRLSIKRKAGIK
jgi:hypothetical protein